MQPTDHLARWQLSLSACVPSKATKRPRKPDAQVTAWFHEQRDALAKLAQAVHCQDKKLSYTTSRKLTPARKALHERLAELAKHPVLLADLVMAAPLSFAYAWQYLVPGAKKFLARNPVPGGREYAYLLYFEDYANFAELFVAPSAVLPNGMPASAVVPLLELSTLWTLTYFRGEAKPWTGNPENLLAIAKGLLACSIKRSRISLDTIGLLLANPNGPLHVVNLARGGSIPQSHAARLLNAGIPANIVLELMLHCWRGGGTRTAFHSLRPTGPQGPGLMEMFLPLLPPEHIKAACDKKPNSLPAECQVLLDAALAKASMAKELDLAEPASRRNAAAV